MHAFIEHSHDGAIVSIAMSTDEDKKRKVARTPRPGTKILEIAMPELRAMEFAELTERVDEMKRTLRVDVKKGSLVPVKRKT